MLYLAWDREINISLFFCDVFVWKWGPRPRTSSRCYHGNKSAATFKKGIFVHPPWVPNCMQNLKGGWKFSFPKMFDSYRDLFLSLKPGQMSYGKRLLALDMLPLAYDREIKDLVFLYKAVYWHIDIDVSNYVTFNNHPPTRRSQSAGCYLTFPAYKTCTLRASYFVRIVKLWNKLCQEAFPSGFTYLSCFKSFSKNLYKSFLMNVFYADMVIVLFPSEKLWTKFHNASQARLWFVRAFFFFYE